MKKVVVFLLMSILFFSCAGNEATEKDRTELLKKYDRSFNELDEETGRSPEEVELERIEKDSSGRIDRDSSSGNQASDDYPAWFYNPGLQGYLGAVGSAKKQARGGYAAQKRLAVTIAEAELARQIEVLVNAEVHSTRTVISAEDDEFYRTKLKSMSRQESRQFLKNAVVKDEWTDPETGELHIWVVIKK